MEAITRTGRAFYGIAMINTGIVQLYYADFRTVLIPPWPEWRLNPTLAAGLLGLIILIWIFAFSGIAFLIAFLDDPETHLKKRTDVVSEHAATPA